MPLSEEVDIVNDYLQKKRKLKKNEDEEPLLEVKKKPLVEKKGITTVFSGIFGRKQTEPKIVVQTKETVNKPVSKKDIMLEENNADFDNMPKKQQTEKKINKDIEITQEIPDDLKKELQQDQQNEKKRDDDSGEVIILDKQEAMVKPVIKIVEAKPTPRKMPEFTEQPKKIKPMEDSPPIERNEFEDIQDLLGEEKKDSLEEEEKLETEEKVELEEQYEHEDDTQNQKEIDERVRKFNEEVKERDLPAPKQQEELDIPLQMDSENQGEKKPFLGPVFPEKKPMDDTRKQMLKALKDLIDKNEPK